MVIAGLVPSPSPTLEEGKGSGLANRRDVTALQQSISVAQSDLSIAWLVCARDSARTEDSTKLTRPFPSLRVGFWHETIAAHAYCGTCLLHTK